MNEPIDDRCRATRKIICTIITVVIITLTYSPRRSAMSANHISEASQPGNSTRFT